MNINLKQLETFVLVADLGSFRQAAHRLNTTQPNVSSRIASLESELGKVLMERDAGSVRLTPQGQDLLSYARSVLTSMDQFIAAAGSDAVFDNVIRLGVTEMVVHTWLRDFMHEFKARFPNVMVELSVDLSVNLERELSKRHIDLAFQSGPFTRRASGELSLGVFPVIWVASPSIGLPDDRRISSEQMSQFPILTHARSTRPYDEVAAHFGQWSSLKVHLVPSSNLAACLQMTMDGYGIAALLAPMVDAELVSCQLMKLDYAWSPEPLSFAARYDRHKSTRAVQCAAEIAQRCAQKYDTHFKHKEFLND